ncbi:N-acetylmuramoyl-L-alanine amidase [Macrococcus bovicus]
MSKRILLTAGHGGNDPGAVGNGTNERDFIRENIVDNIAKYLRKAGNDVTVFDKKYDMLTWTFDPSKQYGLYWAKKQKFDEVIEFHLDAASPSASGGHTIIWGGFNPDKMDTRIQKALSDTVGVIRPISKRTDLGNARIAAELGVSYRLVELGFITSKKDMNYIKGNLQSFTKEIAEAIHGGGIDDPKRAEKKKPASLSNATTHKVVKGDTLYSISKKYGVTIKDLIDLNNKIKSKNYKDNTQIAVGTVLKVK